MTSIPIRTSLRGRGIDSSAGVVIGRVQKLLEGRKPIPEYHLSEEQVDIEARRLDLAIEQALEDLVRERDQLAKMGAQDPLLILEAHRMLLMDPELVGKARRMIREEGINAEWAMRRRMDAVLSVFDAIEDEYLRGKKVDVEQAVNRVLRHLMGELLAVADGMDELPQILVGVDFSPPDVVSLWNAGVAGLVAEQGGVNAHNIIVARGIGLPAIVGASDILEQAEDDDLLILDGEQGIWILNPTQEEQDKYRRFAEAISIVYAGLHAFAEKPSLSIDGHPMQLMANIEFAEEAKRARDIGAEGVGLFRTEFMFMNAGQLPDEDVQFAEYGRVVQLMDGRQVTFRLLDVGGDKPGLYRNLSGYRYDGQNPAMGMRGVRLLLHWPALLETQLRAMLRAAEYGPVQIMIPMVSAVHEVEQVRDILEQCRRQVAPGSDVRLGTMIEVPAAVMIADQLAGVADFFSIGTNDLIQYTLAVDRGDEQVGHLYSAGHPAVRRLLELSARAAHKAGIPVSVCGELAADSQWTETFLNLGMDTLSMSLNQILPIRKHLSRLHYRPSA
jgi:phosphoenolpyruvate-protein phosphotransferase (PTS system enzyme I)